MEEIYILMKDTNSCWRVSDDGRDESFTEVLIAYKDRNEALDKLAKIKEACMSSPKYSNICSEGSRFSAEVNEPEWGDNEYVIFYIEAINLK